MKLREEAANFNQYSTLFRLLNFSRKVALKEVILIGLISSITGMTALLVLFSLEGLIDSVSLVILEDTKEYHMVVLWLSVLIFVILFTRLLSVFGTLMTGHFQEKLKEKFTQEIMEKAHRLSLADFDRSSLYDRLVRVNQGMDHRLFTTMTFMIQMITRLATIVSILIYLLFINWLIPVILLVGSVVFTTFQMKVFKERYVLNREQTTPSRKLAYLTHLMTGREPSRELRLYNLQGYVKREWNQINSSLIHERMKLTRKESRRDLIGQSGNTLTFALTLLIIIFMIMKKTLSIGQYAVFIRAVISFQQELISYMYNMASVQADLRYIHDFFTYLDLEEEQRKGIELNTKNNIGKGIQFHDVNFSYPETENEVIKGISLEIKPGEKIALVGGNGSGKSTLIKLLLGLYKPSEGRIKIDGLDMSEIDLNDWWKRTTAVFQDFQKYQILNVQENIAIGQIESMTDFVKVKEAAILSGADEIIQSLPSQYETILGKEFGGVELSLGQWQRIAVARAYIRDAELLVLDEPTASLDPKAEYEVYRQFEQAAQDKTVVFISHRLGVAKLADRIIVLKEGEIIEEGSHAELIKNKGHYANLYDLQAQWYK